jgi:hypothetical protein
MLRTSVNPFLLHQVTSGRYVVDPQAVAEAMLTRLPRQRAGGRLGSPVLVALERFERFVVGADEDGPHAA